MVDVLNSAGLYLDDFTTRLARIKSTLRAAISPTLELTDNDELGQTVSILTEEIQEVVEIVQLAYNAGDPDQASAHSLQALSTITGTERNEATFGTVTLRVNLDGGVTLLAGKIAGTSADEENRWATDEDEVAPPGPAADYDVAATCITVGEIVAPAGTIDQIVTPVGGWNSVTNVLDADNGSERQEDVSLRLDREQEVFLGGSTSVTAIKAGLSALTGIIHAIVYHNPHWYAGVFPPHCVAPCIYDGTPAAVDNADIAEVIFTEKAGGMLSFGTTSEVYEDTQGEFHTIKFYRAAVAEIKVEIWLYVDTNTYAGDLAVQTAIAAAINALVIGEDVPRSLVVDAASDVTGVVSVEMINGGHEPLLAIKPAGVANSDLSIGRFLIARVTAAAVDIIVHTTAV